MNQKLKVTFLALFIITLMSSKCKKKPSATVDECDPPVSAQCIDNTSCCAVPLKLTLQKASGGSWGCPFAPEWSSYSPAYNISVLIQNYDYTKPTSTGKPYPYELKDLYRYQISSNSIQYDATTGKPYIVFDVPRKAEFIMKVVFKDSKSSSCCTNCGCGTLNIYPVWSWSSPPGEALLFVKEYTANFGTNPTTCDKE